MYEDSYIDDLYEDRTHIPDEPIEGEQDESAAERECPVYEQYEECSECPKYGTKKCKWHIGEGDND